MNGDGDEDAEAIANFEFLEKRGQDLGQSVNVPVKP